MGLLKGTMPAASAIQDLNTVTELLATTLDELTVGGYARVALTSESATEDDTDNRSEGGAATVDFGNLTTGESIVAYFLFKEGANDDAREVLAVNAFTNGPIPTNGAGFTVPIPTYILGVASVA